MLNTRNIPLRTLACAVLLLLLAWPALVAAQASSQAQHDHSYHAQTTEDKGTAGGLFELYVPRRVCMFEQSDVIWLHVISDALIAAAYYSIPIALLFFVRKRPDLYYRPMFVMFACFILACGTTHVFSILAIWYPLYRLDGFVKAFTALVSVGTAIWLWPLIPHALAIPSPRQLATANESLAREVEDRKNAQSDLEAMKIHLERRVKERTAELEQANQIKDEFLATLSHELRTPLNAILGWTQMLRLGSLTPAESAQALETIERNTRVQSQLIEDLLDMNRIIAGKIRLDVKTIDMVDVVDAALETIHPAAVAKEITVTKTAHTPRALVNGDFGRLQQVVWNLLSNAVKFTPKGGRIAVKIESAISHVNVTVTDSGMGIHADFLPFVFDRFRQADQGTTRRHGGLGLGLAIVKHLVEMHGGSVSVQSAGEGRGSTFTVQLPVNVAQMQPEPTKVEHRHLAPLQAIALVRLDGVRVLLVDDERDALDVLGRILRGVGATVETAGSVAEAMAKISLQAPDLLVSDIGMPVEDGYALIKQVRALPLDKGGATPAVAVTAFARSEDRRRALMAGFQMHIAKPVDAAEFAAVVASVAGKVRH